MKIIKNSFKNERENEGNHHHHCRGDGGRHRRRRHWYNEFLLVKHHGLMVSDNENADRIFFFFFQLKNSIQTYNYVFLWNFGVLGVHLPYSLHFAEKAKHISESRLIELFNWCANSTAQHSIAELINTFTSIFFASIFYAIKNSISCILIKLTRSRTLIMIMEQKKNRNFSSSLSLSFSVCFYPTH